MRVRQRPLLGRRREVLDNVAEGGGEGRERERAAEGGVVAAAREDAVLDAVATVARRACGRVEVRQGRVSWLRLPAATGRATGRPPEAPQP